MSGRGMKCPVCMSAPGKRRQQADHPGFAGRVLHRLLFPMLHSGGDLRAEIYAGHIDWPPFDCKAPGLKVGSAEGADAAVAHGCTAKGMTSTFQRIYLPWTQKLKVIAPWREWKDPIARGCPGLPAGRATCPFRRATHPVSAVTGNCGNISPNEAGRSKMQLCPRMNPFRVNKLA